jgi:anti-sigma regulatory factor (Ser/Thr protein kinase)
MNSAVAPLPPRVHVQRFNTGLDQVRAARRFVRGCLGATHPRCDDAQLLVSEIVTNAFAHTDSSRVGIEVIVVTYEDMARVSVLDAGSESVPCVRRDSAGHHTSGRGLAIVEATADEWGFQRLSSGAGEVWVLLRCPVA